MPISEAILLLETLRQDPTSWVHAAIAKWQWPASREFLALADVFDAIAKAHFKKPKPYHRPMPDGSTKVEQLGERIAFSDLAEVLRGFGRLVPDELLAEAPPSQPE